MLRYMAGCAMLRQARAMLPHADICFSHLKDIVVTTIDLNPAGCDKSPFLDGLNEDSSGTIANHLL